MTIHLPVVSDSDASAATPGGAPAAARSGEPRRMRLLVSACLLGERVRYDGGHKRDPFLVETLGPFVEWVRVCPEADAGMPIPRPAMHLVGDPAAPRLVASRSGADLTEPLLAFTRARLRELEDLELCGYVCKKDSPSSGMERVKIYDASGGSARRIGVGLFTRAFLERFPHVPVEEEGRLHDPVLRESFVERVFWLRRWREHLAGGRSRHRLIEFHADHKYLLLAHGRPGYTALGRLVAAAKEFSTPALYDRYLELATAALARPSTVARTTDVLQHMSGFFKAELSADEKAELQEVIASYRRGLVPLVVPVTLVRHYVRKYDVAYLARQAFLRPYPEELMLRNHA